MSTGTSTARHHRIATSILGLIGSMCLLVAFGSVHAATLLVDAATGTDAGNCQSVPGCQTIAYAIGQAADGDTVMIQAGSYPEQITINKSISLQGSGQSQTIIQAPGTLVVNPAVTPGAGQQQTTVVFVTGSGVSAQMQDLGVAGPGPDSCGAIGYGIFNDGAELMLDAVTVTMIRDEPISGCQNGRGIGYRNGATGQILNSRIDGFQKTGIAIYDVGTNVTASGNTITGMLGSPLAQNGIDVWNATAVVDGNTIFDLQCDEVNVPACGANGSWSTGITVEDAGSGTIIANNVVNNADGNLVILDDGTTYPVTANHFSDARYTNVQIWDATVDMADNVLTGAQLGLEVYGWGASTTVTLNGGNIITGASDTGIVADSYGNPVLVQGSENQFFANGVGADNYYPDDVVMDLPCNWWGSATGPYHDSGVAGDPNNNPAGQGNPVMDDVDFINWSIDNVAFSCVGNPGYNETPPGIPVPMNAPWALGGGALLLGLLGGTALRRRRPVVCAGGGH